MVFLDRTDKTDEWMDTTNAYRLARVGGGGAVRAEALRASRLYPVNYKFGAVAKLVSEMRL
jgi:hypothetical protein